MSQYYLDVKYARMLGNRLKNFKQKRGELYEFAHTCEDFTKRKVKPRAYLYKQGEELYMKCHHCGASHKFSTFLAQSDPVLADEYRMEKFKDSGEKPDRLARIRNEKKTVAEIKTELRGLDDVLTGLQCIADLPKSHPAVKYVARRAIPEEHWQSLFMAPKFNAYAGRFKEQFKGLSPDKEHPRLILPYFDANGRVYAFTARAFGPEEPKYIYISVDGSNERVYGLWRIDPSKPVFALEGQIDSLCVDNAIAVGGADYSSPILKRLQSKLIVVPDNDFARNKQVADQVDAIIKRGFTVSLFPPTFKHKDLNDALKSGFTKDQLERIIVENAKKGIEAQLELAVRRKV